MRFWWVNQNQTFVQETTGGYLWSPKRSTNGARNPFYEFMREVAPGDLVLSFEGTHIRAIGIARSYAYECPKPPEFGSAGPNWSLIGWKVDVGYHILANQIRPSQTRYDRRTTCRIFGIFSPQNTRLSLRTVGVCRACILPRCRAA
jgi:hypothetical protein